MGPGVAVRPGAPVPEVQNFTAYTAAPLSSAANAEIAKFFVRYLGSPADKALECCRNKVHRPLRILQLVAALL